MTKKDKKIKKKCFIFYPFLAATGNMIFHAWFDREKGIPYNYFIK